jgi:phosphoenolpyruvate---glycerone phosphotransferase subunit DhaL
VSDALKTAILAAADAADAARPELGRLDGAAGDGDHGMTMSIGARNVRRRFQATPPEASDAELLCQVALAMGDVGGAIGPLYAAALTSMATEIESAAAVSLGAVARLRRVAEAAEDAAVGLGHAGPGDKTVIDALHPVVVALRDAEAGADDLRTAIEAAAEAAETGAASTADMVARIGRASRLGGRSRGLPDAGATSFAIIVRAVADSTRKPPLGDA